MFKTCLATNFAFYEKTALACNFHKTSRQDRFEADGLYFFTERQQVRQNRTPAVKPKSNYNWRRQRFMAVGT
jgi:hypothetical protein